MHVFWLNGGLVLHPDTDQEGEALELLFETTTTEKGRPQSSDRSIAPASNYAGGRRLAVTGGANPLLHCCI